MLRVRSRLEHGVNGDLGTVIVTAMGSEGSCNLVQEISFHIVKFLNFWYLKSISALLCQNFGISGGFEPPSVRHCSDQACYLPVQSTALKSHVA
jgi:hypothetical protein